MDNPVYYAQYAHARCASLLRRARELEAPTYAVTPELLRALTLPEEIVVLRRLSDFPDFLADAAAAREPHRLVQYIQELASDFQSYYTRLQKVHGDSILPQQRQRVGDWRATWDWQKTAARLHWVEAIRRVIETALGLLGVSAPTVMKRIGEEGEEAS
jgi:arginyl-tRNA synthetase